MTAKLLVIPLLVCVASGAVAVFVARPAVRPAARWAFVAIVAAGAMVFLLRASTPAVVAAPSDPAVSPYESFYRAKLWSEREPRGAVELARRAQQLGLFRTCVEAAQRALDAKDAAIEATARELAATCKRDAEREPTP